MLVERAFEVGNRVGGDRLSLRSPCAGAWVWVGVLFVFSVRVRYQRSFLSPDARRLRNDDLLIDDRAGSSLVGAAPVHHFASPVWKALSQAVEQAGLQRKVALGQPLHLVPSLELESTLELLELPRVLGLEPAHFRMQIPDLRLLAGQVSRHVDARQRLALRPQVSADVLDSRLKLADLGRAQLEERLEGLEGQLVVRHVEVAALYSLVISNKEMTVNDGTLEA